MDYDQFEELVAVLFELDLHRLEISSLEWGSLVLNADNFEELHLATIGSQRRQHIILYCQPQRNDNPDPQPVPEPESPDIIGDDK